jgi:YD repeat-containing protein
MCLRKILALILLLTGVSSAQPDLVNEMKEIIKKSILMKNNGIREQRIYYIKADSGFIPSGEKFLESVEKYDENGRVIYRAVNFSETDTSDMIRYYIYHFDDDHLADMILTGQEKDTTLLTYKRDAKGNVTDYISVKKSDDIPGGLVSGYQCVYDKENRLIVIKENDTELMRYNYNPDGNISSIETEQTVTRFEYDSRGRIIRRIVSAPDHNEKPEKSTFTYLKDDLYKTVVVESGDGSVFNNRYVYDDRDLQMKIYYEEKNVQSDSVITHEYVIVEFEYK